MLLFLTTAASIASVEASRLALQAIRLTYSDEQVGYVIGMLRSHGIRDPQSIFLVVAACAISLPVLTYVGIYFRDFVFEWIAIQVTRSLRVRVYSHVLELPYLSFLAVSVGTLAKRITMDTMQVRRLVLEGVLFRTADLVLTIGLLAYLISLDIRLTSIVAANLVVYFATAFVSAKLARTQLRRADQSFERLANNATEVLQRLADVRVNGRASWEAAAFAATADADAQTNLSCACWLVIDKCSTTVLSTLGPVIVMVFGGLLVLRGTLSLETLVAFSGATAMLYNPVNNLSAIPILLQRVKVSTENLDELFARSIEDQRTGVRPCRRQPSAMPPPAPSWRFWRWPIITLPLRAAWRSTGLKSSQAKRWR